MPKATTKRARSKKARPAGPDVGMEEMSPAGPATVETAVATEEPAEGSIKKEHGE